MRIWIIEKSNGLGEWLYWKVVGQEERAERICIEDFLHLYGVETARIGKQFIYEHVYVLDIVGRSIGTEGPKESYRLSYQKVE